MKQINYSFEAKKAIRALFSEYVQEDGYISAGYSSAHIKDYIEDLHDVSDKLESLANILDSDIGLKVAIMETVNIIDCMHTAIEDYYLEDIEDEQYELIEEMESKQ